MDFWTFFNSVPLPIWLHDRDTFAFLEANSGFLDAVGYQRDELLAMQIGDLFPPNEIPPQLLDLKLNHQPEPTPTRGRIRRPDGHWIAVELSTSPVDFDGHPAALVTVLRWGDLETSYRSIMNEASEGIFIADLDGNYLDVNPAGCDLVGYTRDEVLTLALHDLMEATPDIPSHIETMRQGASLLTERFIRRKDGSLFLAEISAKMLLDGCLLGIVRDITHRKQEEERLRYLALILDKISSAVISTNAQLQIIHWNKAAEDLYGWPEREVLGLQVDDVCRTEFQGNSQQEARSVLAVEKKWRGELKQYHRSGRELWVDASVTLLEDESGIVTGGVAINTDITERKLAEEELRRTKESIEEINITLRHAFEREQIASRTDGLTGVFNRRYFFELLEYEFIATKRYQHPLSIVMFDVDRLKNINDTFGHLVGDEVLKQVASIVRSQLRESDILARYGGDEFAILLPNSAVKETQSVLRRIHQKIKQAEVVMEHELPIPITISAGVASWQPGLESTAQLIRLADEALYAAKGAGRDRIFFSDQGQFEP